MKIRFIEMSGFRGFREPIRLAFSNSFTVISGRNGVGKSTICDAIEFTITGEIRKYRTKISDGESISDYVWWRGRGKAKKHYVKIGFIDNDGVLHEILRTREEGLLVPVDTLTDLLCSPSGRPFAPLQQLCSTTIIRDEWIAAQSLDLKETERFDLVSAALGEVETSNYREKTNKVMKIAEDDRAKAEIAYEESRTNLSRALAELSEEQSSVRQTGNISTALANISKYILQLPEDLPDAITASHHFLTNTRGRISILSEAAGETQQIFEENKLIESQKFQTIKASVISEIETLKTNRSSVSQRLSEAKQALDTEELSHSLSAALSKIIEGGNAVGLNNGHCPLCDAERSPEEFYAGLALATKRAGELGKTLADASKRIDDLRLNYKQLTDQLTGAEEKLRSIENIEGLLRKREEQQIEFFTENDLDFKMVREPSALSEKLQSLRNDMIEVERNVATLESSRSVARIADREATVAELRKTASIESMELEKRKKAVSLAREFEYAVRRTSAEIIDERLAAISPLLTELYQRLRPHSDWRGIEYSIRGDVRRFLSLKVGEKLNPQFVFSSGQRRIAGIAFLLSVHLARPWCQLNTLILDDPVQHIDDFRAIHLVELFASLCRDGQQIICTVEDLSLASLLTRRLYSTPNSPGNRYNLARDGSGIASAHLTEIAPIPANVEGFSQRA